MAAVTCSLLGSSGGSGAGKAACHHVPSNDGGTRQRTMLHWYPPGMVSEVLCILPDELCHAGGLAAALSSRGATAFAIVTNQHCQYAGATPALRLPPARDTTNPERLAPRSLSGSMQAVSSARPPHKLVHKRSISPPDAVVLRLSTPKTVIQCWCLPAAAPPDQLVPGYHWGDLLPGNPQLGDRQRLIWPLSRRGERPTSHNANWPHIMYPVRRGLCQIPIR